ncbi:MAG: radical SAM family heme chaperone HemW [Bacilli bacterium]|nr:radical SAM family heme chaperone HemW [Bacilli bacterium]
MISIYIHIPFCNTICSYCDFCKMYYKKEWVSDYLKALKEEIKSSYNGEKVRTLYIGGGTPSALSVDELNILFDIIKIFDLSSLEEFTIEANVENLNKEKMKLFLLNNVNRLSIGIQSFNIDNLKFLNRNYNEKDINNIIKDAREVGFKNINVDLIYGLPNQTIDNLKEDLNKFLNLKTEHISLYSLIIEEHTKLYIDKIKDIDEDLNYEMYEYINNTLKNNNYNHYEVSNYCKEGYESKHNLTYWHNEEYYGFGLGASSYYKGRRYSNTQSLNKYLNKDYIYEDNRLSKKEIMQNEMILGLRTIKGVNKKDFYKKYNLYIEDVFDIKDLIKKGLLEDNNEYIKILEDKLFISNEVLLNFID